MMSRFFAIGHFTNYIKPVAGVLTDSVPFLGFRRRSYLLLSLLGAAVGYLSLAFLPRQYNVLLVAYTIMYMTVVFISTTLGGVMVEVGTRFRAAGRLTAQRIGSFRVGALAGGLTGGFLVQFPLWVATGITAVCHIILFPLFWVALKEERRTEINREAWRNAKQQFVALFRNKTLMSAAGMIFLIAVAPGFGTPLFYYQTNALKFDPKFLGFLGILSALGGITGSWYYYHLCHRVNLRWLIVWSVVQHGIATLFYLLYRDAQTAMWITAFEGVSQILATLPVYDLAARGTPKGSEALGYSVMMSVWNFTNAFSDWAGSVIFGKLGQNFAPMIWINASTTFLALAAVPFLPAALLVAKDAKR
jgi:MFS family permease